MSTAMVTAETPARLKPAAPTRKLLQRRARSVTARVALELAELALELRLTAKQRLFCEEMVIRCDGNITQAAQAAGITQSRGSRALDEPRVQTFLAALKKAIAGPVADELELTLYEGAHALARLTEIAEGQVPGSIDRPITVSPVDGTVRPDTEVNQTEHYPILEATRDILAHYKVGQAAPGAGGNRTMIINVGKLAPEQLDAIGANVKALLSETE